MEKKMPKAEELKWRESSSTEMYSKAGWLHLVMN
jgi:hypothetical protein